MQYLYSSSKIKPICFIVHICYKYISSCYGQNKEYCIKMMILIPKYIHRAHVTLYTPHPLPFLPSLPPPPPPPSLSLGWFPSGVIK